MKIVVQGIENKVTCYVLNMNNTQSGRPALLWFHGGGYILGSALMVYQSVVKKACREANALLIAPEYRLAGKHPYPAALEDCYASLEYIFEHADALGIDRDRISVGGESAGGGLAAAVCMYARDRGKVKIKSQLPIYPMLDCEDTESSRDNHAHLWNTRKNHYAWRKYLRNLDPDQPVPPYASPARQTDYAGLPPAYSFVCDGDPFYAETLRYIENLRNAGVDARVDVYHANTHAFESFCLWSETAARARRAFIENVRVNGQNVLVFNPTKLGKGQTGEARTKQQHLPTQPVIFLGFLFVACAHR